MCPRRNDNNISCRYTKFRNLWLKKLIIINKKTHNTRKNYMVMFIICRRLQLYLLLLFFFFFFALNCIKPHTVWELFAKPLRFQKVCSQTFLNKNNYLNVIVEQHQLSFFSLHIFSNICIFEYTNDSQMRRTLKVISKCWQGK